MSHTFSTRQRDADSGQMFSSRHGRMSLLPRTQPMVPPGGQRAAPVPQPLVQGVQVPQPPAQGVPVPQELMPGVQQALLQGGPGGPQALAPVVQQAPPQVAAPPPERTFHFTLSTVGQPGAAKVGAAVAGTVTLTGRAGAPHAVTGALSGLTANWDPAVQPVLWLLHDLTVPADIHPADLSLLPHGVTGQGNQPGSVFTMDGNPPTYGQQSSTVSIAVTPGSFARTAGGAWQLTGSLDAGTNQAFHPLVLLGPTVLADIHATIASGTLARILTDQFMRPATVRPDLPVRTHFGQRLMAIVQEVLSTQNAPAYLDPALFTRCAVTLEGLVRATPRLMPTRESCFLGAQERQGG